jgi:hypothetical protein
VSKLKKGIETKWIAVVVIISASCLCAVAAGCCRALTRISYFTLRSAPSAAAQAAWR